jgi:hypothetical protein
MLTGNVSKTMRGVIYALTKPRTIAVKSAPRVVTVAPGTTNAEIPIAIAAISHVISIVVIVSSIIITKSPTY